MNDRPDRPAPDDEAPEIAEVRRLLADARHTEPMPDDVAQRMERVIARLGDEEPAATPAPSAGGEVIPIAAHRRRRAAGLLVAAAAIVVGGVVVSQNLHPSASSSGSTAGGNVPEANAFDSSKGDTSHGLNGGDTKNGTTTIRKGAVVVRPRHFAQDALHGRRLLPVRMAPQATDQLARLADCGVRPKQGRVVPAEYEKAPAALLYARPRGGAQVVSLFVCGSSQPIKTTTLPAP